ncbi:MAG: hypothetical protein JWN91_2864, partial [Nocardioides sp.]|nr:hypothetical protein [Nocardioides sp.]
QTLVTGQDLDLDALRLQVARLTES